jgi:hypothetical protein
VILNEIEIPIDGSYVAALAKSGGPWTGSANQPVIDWWLPEMQVRLCYLTRYELLADRRPHARTVDHCVPRLIGQSPVEP